MLLHHLIQNGQLVTHDFNTLVVDYQYLYQDYEILITKIAYLYQENTLIKKEEEERILRICGRGVSKQKAKSLGYYNIMKTRSNFK